ncbi:MAG: ABC transporter permease [Candidatus Brockarchaeota archaeon]|nr:ABC transporter permease [Candidatus Brockarchaeota archaeon]
MRIKPMVSFIIRDLKLMIRDKTFVFWLVAWPLIWIFMTAYIFVPPTGDGGTIVLNLGIVNLDSSQTPLNGSSLIKFLEEAEYNDSKLFNVKSYQSEEEALRALRRGELDGVIVVPEGLGYAVINPVEKARLHAYVGSRTPESAQISSSIIIGFLERFSEGISFKRVEKAVNIIKWLPVSEEEKRWFNATVQGIMRPLDLTIDHVSPEFFEDRVRTLGWYTIGAIGMMFLYFGFNSGAILIVSEKERGTLRKLFSTPLTEGEFIVGSFLSQLTTLLISALILILVGISPAVGARIVLDPLNPIHLLAVAFMVCGALMSMSIGALVSLLSKTVRGASGMGTVLGLLLSFTTGIWFPLEWMPQPVRLLAVIFPPAWSIETSRRILVFETFAETLILDSVKIFSSTAILLALALLTYRIRIKQYAES